MSSGAIVRRLWTKEEDHVLRREVEFQLSQGNLKNWKAISEKLPGRTNKDCRKRWSKVCEPVKKGAWSSAENERLKRAVNLHGFNWIQVAQSVESRHADQCAKRWRHCLDPSIDHSRWTPSDDMRLLKAVEDYGHNWRAIENKEFQGRSPTNIKNRYVLINRKGYHSMTLSSPSPTAHIEPHAERPDDFEEEGEESDCSDSDIDDSDRSPRATGIPGDHNTNPSDGSSTTYNTGVPTPHILPDHPSYPRNQATSFLNTNELFSMPPTDDFFEGAANHCFWNDLPLATPQLEHWQPETNHYPDLASITPREFTNPSTPGLVSSLDSERHEDSNHREDHHNRRNSVGKRLILDNVQPEVVSTIVKMLYDSGADIKMRLESTETAPEDQGNR